MQIKEPGVRSSYSDGRPELYVGMPCDIEVLLGDGGVVWPSPIDADAEPGRPAGVSLQSAVKEAGGQLEQVLEMEGESIVSSDTVLDQCTTKVQLAHRAYERILSNSEQSTQERAKALIGHAALSVALHLYGTAFRDLQAIDDLLGQGVVLDQQQRNDYLELRRDASERLGIDPLTAQSTARADTADYPSGSAPPRRLMGHLCDPRYRTWRDCAFSRLQPRLRPTGGGSAMGFLVQA